MDGAGRVLIVEAGGAGRGDQVRILTEAGYTATAMEWRKALAPAGGSEAGGSDTHGARAEVSDPLRA